jgi:hypothetical protein
MAIHYSSAKYAASIKIKSVVWGAAFSSDRPALMGGDFTRSVGYKAKAHGLAEAERLLRQDRQPI